MPEQDGHGMCSFNIGHYLHRFTRNESGATAIEYALIACGVSIAIVTSVTTVGQTMMSIYYDKLLNLF
jgi:pilus assembly protein Flp/PilA